MLLLIAAAALVKPPDVTFASHQAPRGRSAVESVEKLEKTCCLHSKHDGGPDDALTLGVQHNAGPPPTPNGTSTPNHVPRTMEDTTSNKFTVYKNTSYKTTYYKTSCAAGASASGHHPTGGTCRTGRSANAPAKNAEAEAATTTTTLQHTRVCPVSCPGEPTEMNNLILFEGHHAPACGASIDTIQNAAQTPEPPRSVLVIPTKTTAGTGVAAATVDRPPGAPLDTPDPVSKRLSALRHIRTSRQDPLHSVTIQVTINHTTKIVGQGGSTLLLSARDDNKEDVSLVGDMH
jgi:hypothetical protein